MKTATTIWIFLAALAALAPVAAADDAPNAPTPETLLPVRADRDAYAPAAAAGRDGFLVVWQSGRFAPGDLREGLANLAIADIVGCRVDKAGKAIDAKPFVICAAKDLQAQPVVAGSDGGFLVVWHDLRSGADWDVYAARVSSAGKVLDPDGFLVAGGVHNQALPAVAWDGRNFVVAWQDFRSGHKYQVYAARVSSDGKVLDPQGVLVGENPHYSSGYAAAASPGGGRSLVFWPISGKYPQAGATFFADGKAERAALYGDGKVTPHGPGRGCVPVCLAAGAKGYLAAWRTDVSAGRGLAPNGSTAMVLDDKGQLVKRLFVDGEKKTRIQAPAAAWDGSAYVVAWQEIRKRPERPRINPYMAVAASRISETGELIGQVQLLSGSLESPAAEPTIASDGHGATLVAYEKHPATGETPIAIGCRLLGAE